jgi:uncharacterized protein (TIGR02996 family)
MRTFTFSDGKSNKFWNIDLQDTQFTVTYGRAGARGQTQTKTFATAATAAAAHDKLVREKLAKGYVETTPAAALTPEDALGRQVREDPDDVATLGVYADRLSELGDPRGEFIHVQLALEQEGVSAERRQQLQQREKELFGQHGRGWLGGLAEYLLDQHGVDEHTRKTLALGGEGGYQFRCARGRLDSLKVPYATVAFSRLLARSPEAGFLRRLELNRTPYDDEYEEGDDVPAGVDSAALYPLRRAPFLGTLRVFQLGEAVEDEQAASSHMRCHTSGEGAAELVGQMPRLEELYLLAHRVNLDGLFALKNLTNLRVLQVYHCYRYPLETLADNPAFGRLTHLLLHPHALEPGDEQAYITLDGVRAVLRSRHLRDLTHLRLRLSDLGDEGCEEVVRSGALRRLKVLDLMHGRITDRGAAVLAACPDLRNLDLLEVSFNQITPAGVEVLRRTGVKVQATSQYQPGDEFLYLEAGDWE